MAHPKRKTSKARKHKRRGDIKLKDVTLTKCDNCGSFHKMHHACVDCGYYRGRQVLAVN